MTRRGGSWRWRSPLAALGLGPRIFLAMALVVLAGAGTMLLVALAVAPQVFAGHLHQAGVPSVPTEVQAHVDEAFGQAVLLSLGVGLLVAVAASALVALLVSRRLAAPVGDLVRVTEALTRGEYGTSVADPGLGPEHAMLATAVNELAERLSSSEELRRRLLTDLTHELRTPLASLEVTVEAIEDGVLPVDQTTLSTLSEQARRLHRLVSDLESVSRAEERQLALEPQPLRLVGLAERAVGVLRPRFDSKGVVLSLHPTADPWVVVDADRIVEALMNLLDNALRHSDSGGEVRVYVGISPEVVTPRRGAPRGDCRDSATVSVSDAGDGFDPAVAERLFERFYRADPARTARAQEPGLHGSGAGIGLTITRAIVVAHHGQIAAVSAGLGRGATFTITLPRVQASERH